MFMFNYFCLSIFKLDIIFLILYTNYIINYNIKDRDIIMGRGKKVVFTLLVIVFIIGAAIFYLNNTGFISIFDQKKDFAVNNDEFKITLTSDFTQDKTNLDTVSTTKMSTGVIFSSNDVVLQVFKIEFDDFVNPNLTEFAKICSARFINYNDSKKLCYTEKYERTDVTDLPYTVYSKIYFFKAKNNKYYQFVFSFKGSYESKITKYAESIKFSDEIVFDVDKNIFDSKSIVLNSEDGVTMNIAPSYLKCKENSAYNSAKDIPNSVISNCYPKVTFYTNAISTKYTQLEYSSTSKSSFDSLNDYSSYVIDYWKTQYGLVFSTPKVKNNNILYVKTRETRAVSGVNSYYDSYIYFAESTNGYHCINFVTNDTAISEIVTDSYIETLKFLGRIDTENNDTEPTNTDPNNTENVEENSPSLQTITLNENVTISDDVNENATYTQSQFGKLESNIKVKISTEMQKQSLPMIINSRKGNVENGKSFIMTNLSNNYALQDEGKLLDTNDIVVYEITNPENKLYFSYIDSKGNENTNQNTSLTLTYVYNRNERYSLLQQRAFCKT